MKPFIIRLSVLFFILCLGSCQKENINLQIEREYKNVDSKLWIHFQNFEDEARKRGLQVDLDAAGIIGIIGETEHISAVGMCAYNMNRPHEIVIDKHFWMRSSHVRRELIVFHELGHCFLKRPHNDDASFNGNCLSVMRSGQSGCIDNYSLNTRETYLDELFGGY